MYKASDLVRSLATNSNDLMPPYEYALIEEIKREANENWNKMMEISEPTQQPSTSTAEVDTNDRATNLDKRDEERVVGARYTLMDWTKRCIIVYHFIRLERLKKLRWEYGNTLPEEIKKNISPQEREWFENYNDNLFSYMKNLGHGGLDLTLYMRPPKRLYIQVKCIKDLGQVDLDNGQQVMLKKDSMLYLPLSQCEKLIHQGILEQTSS